MNDYFLRFMRLSGTNIISWCQALSGLKEQGSLVQVVYGINQKFRVSGSYMAIQALILRNLAQADDGLRANLKDVSKLWSFFRKKPHHKKAYL